jgi:hypothetical protein
MSGVGLRRRGNYTSEWGIPVSLTELAISMVYYSGVKLWPWRRGSGSLIAGRSLQENIYILSKHKSVSISTGRHSWDVQFITGLESNLCTTVTRPNKTENYVSHGRINSQAQGPTALQPIVFLTGIHQLLVLNVSRSDFPLRNHCKGQSRAPE